MDLKLLSKSALYLFTLCASTSAFAQVKIGTNPSVIESTSNLEVEGSTAGRKVKVNKTTGQVTITDGTQGAGKVLTSDANGASSWQNALTGSMVNGTGGSEVVVPTGAGQNQQMVNSQATITFPKAGTYIVFAKWIVTNPTSSFNSDGHSYINTELSTSNTSNTRTGVTAEWVYLTDRVVHSTPGFKVTATAGQTMYFWFFTGWFSGTAQMQDTYAIGPF